MEEPDEEKAKEAAEFFKAVYFGLTAEEKEEEPEECAECSEEKPSCSGKYAVRETESGFSFRLLAGNNQVIGVSEVYSGRAAMEKGIASVRKNAPEAKIEDLTDENAEKVTNPKFEIYNDKAGEFRFRLKARNGEIILASEGYKTKASCENGIESVRKNSAGEIAE
ncbi:MAG: YegP family protein [Oscillospiraceae bacterium]|nr:YegP family protein [Oscillospiraceae bacterium]